MSRLILGPSSTPNMGVIREALSKNEDFDLPMSDCSASTLAATNLDTLRPLSPPMSDCSASTVSATNLDNLRPLSPPPMSSISEIEEIPLNQIQTGVIEFSAQRNCSPIQEMKEFQISFSTPFDEQPQVGILFADIESSNKEATRIYSEVTVITKRFFKVRMGTSPNSGSEIFKMKVSWIATTHPGLQIMQVKLGSYPKDPIQKPTSMRLDYHRRLSQQPKIVAALNSVDIDRHNDRCIHITLSDVGIDGFSFNVNVWNKAKFWKVGYTFVIISDETLATTRWVPSSSNPAAPTTVQQGIGFDFKARTANHALGFPSSTYPFHKLQLPFLNWCKFDLSNATSHKDNTNGTATASSSSTTTQAQSPLSGFSVDNGTNALLDLLPLSQYYPVVIPVLQGFDTCKHHANGIETVAQFSLSPTTETELLKRVLLQQAQPRLSQQNSESGSFVSSVGNPQVDTAFPSDSFMGSRSGSFMSNRASAMTTTVTARCDNTNIHLDEFNFLHVFAHATHDCKATSIQAQVLVLNRNSITGEVKENVIVLSDR